MGLQGWVARALCMLLAVGAFTCGVAVLKDTTAAPDAPKIADAIVRGAHFDVDGLERLMRRFDHAGARCNFRRMRHWLIIRSQLAGEQLATHDLDAIDAAWAELDVRADAVLACFPRDGLAWLTKTWIGLQRDGPSESVLRALRYSYAFAPRDGWLSVMRNRLALLRFRILPDDLKERALSEFSDLVAARFVGECVSTFLEADELLQARLLAALVPVPTIWKTKFRHELLLAGVEVEVPGVAPRPDRPWNWMQ